jgi:protein-S-isoprenylcysteine O-methyltransferase Ste14
MTGQGRSRIIVGAFAKTRNNETLPGSPLSRERGSLKLNFGTLVVAVLALGLLLLRYGAKIAWTPWQIVGLAIAGPAFLLFVLARIQLGRAFSVRAKASTLVTTGIYARIRNPIYVFGALLSVGIFIFVHRPWLLLIWVPLLPLQWFRVRNEEQVLEAKFGDAYRDYKRKTWF